MKKKTVFNRLFLILAISLLSSVMFTYIIDSFLKDRFYGKIKISTMHNEDSVMLQMLKSKFGINPLETVNERFAKKLYDKIYRSNKAYPCGNIEKINNVLPVVLVSNQMNILIDIIADDLNILENCNNFITDQNR